MVETIIIGVACLAAGSVIGYLSKRTKKPFPRCECLHNMVSGGKSKVVHTSRCELELFHTGPHMVTVESNYSNAGEKIWWENKDSLTNLLK